jgi:hypothetical protein
MISLGSACMQCLWCREALRRLESLASAYMQLKSVSPPESTERRGRSGYDGLPAGPAIAGQA